jgi:hypothetical protein
MIENYILLTICFNIENLKYLINTIIKNYLKQINFTL